MIRRGETKKKIEKIMHEREKQLEGKTNFNDKGSREKNNSKREQCVVMNYS